MIMILARYEAQFVLGPTLIYFHVHVLTFFFSALSYLTTKTLGAVVGDIGPLFILDNRMMMFLNQNCLLFHVITAVSSDIDDMVFKKLFKDCIDVYCIVGHITC